MFPAPQAVATGGAVRRLRNTNGGRIAVDLDDARVAEWPRRGGGIADGGRASDLRVSLALDLSRVGSMVVTERRLRDHSGADGRLLSPSRA